jgi:trimeric autotransporter adhesin
VQLASGTVGDCYTLYDSNTNNIIRGNLATDISANGIDILRGSNSNLIENNTIINAGTGGTETAGIRITDYYPTPLLPSNSNIIKRNIVSGSVGSGILVSSGLGNTITENSLYANGKVGNWPIEILVLPHTLQLTMD